MPDPVHRQPFEVAFGDTDASGWIHFPSVFRYVEAAEHAFLRSRGVPILDREGGWPRVHVDCDYRRPLRFGDCGEVLLFLEKAGGASLTWRFELHRGDEPCAGGSMVTVRVGPDGKPRELEPGIRAALGL